MKDKIILFFYNLTNYIYILFTINFPKNKIYFITNKSLRLLIRKLISLLISILLPNITCPAESLIITNFINSNNLKSLKNLLILSSSNIGLCKNLKFL